MPTYRHNTLAIKQPRSPWVKFAKLRYRFYAILILIVLPPLLYGNNSNVPNSIQAFGYQKINDNLLAQQIQIVASSSSSSVISSVANSNPILHFDLSGQDLQTILKQAGVDAGYIDPAGIIDRGMPLPVPARPLEVGPQEFKIYQHKFTIPLDDSIPRPVNPARNNFVRIESYNINAPIVYSKFSDLFAANSDGTVDFNKSVDTSDTNSPLQKLLQDGVVHLAFTPMPGEIGNSYIVGHSSNYSNIVSNYNQVFKPIEKNGKVGEEFVIYDLYGRELRFRIFESLAIEEEDVSQAYKSFGNRRITTLQTSIVSWRAQKGWWPYQRWLVRGELVQ